MPLAYKGGLCHELEPITHGFTGHAHSPADSHSQVTAELADVKAGHLPALRPHWVPDEPQGQTKGRPQ